MTLFIILCMALSLIAIAMVGWPLLRSQAPDEATGSRAMRFGALSVIAMAPFGAAFIYPTVGAPEHFDPASHIVPDPADQIAAMAPQERAAMVEGMVSGLAARLAAEPNNLDGWRMLAKSYGVMGRHAEAATAWREAVALSQGDVGDWRGLAMSLIEAGDPQSAPAVREAFEAVLEAAPDDPVALFFLGQIAMSQGDETRGRELLTKLRAMTPDTEPFAASLDAMLAGDTDEETDAETPETEAPAADDADAPTPQ